MGLRKEEQFAIEIETTEGTLETFADTSYSGEYRELDYSYNDEEYQRDNSRGTLTRRTPLVSKHGLTIRGTCECIGGAVGSAAPWHKILRACGFGQSTTNVNRFAYTSLTGTAPKIGDIVGNNASQGSATKTGIVIYIDVTNTKVWLHALTGTFANSDAITNYSRTNGFTLNSTATPAGYHFYPQSERAGVRPPSASVAMRDMGQIHQAVGARGNLTMSWMHGKPLLLQFEFTGIPVTTNNLGTPIEPGDTIVPPTIGGVPQVVQALPMQMIEGTSIQTAVATQWDLVLNNTVTLRETATDVCLYESGYLPARITDRNPQITLDPEHVLPADGIDFIGLVRRRTPVRMSSRCAKPNHANGSIIMLAPTASMAAGQSRGDRGGIITRSIKLDCVGNNDDELRIYHIFDPA